MCSPSPQVPKPTFLPIFSDVFNMKRYLDNTASFLPSQEFVLFLKRFSKNEMPATDHKPLATILSRCKTEVWWNPYLHSSKLY